MTTVDLIFAGPPAARWARHFLFWVIIYAFIVVGYFHPGLELIGFKRWMLLTCAESAFQLLVQVLFCYMLVYVLLPLLFMKRKYRLFIASLALLTIIIYVIHYFNHAVFFSSIHHYFGMKFITRPLVYWFSLVSLLTYLPVTTGLFIAIKSFKTWYVKEKNQQELIKFNADAELQLLKAQIHPHFLFNTLNNIYSYLLNGAPGAADLVAKLSGMLNYMLTDCQRLQVPVQMEISLIEHYIGLERVRYGQRLALDMEITGDCRDKTIAPLLMIPFIENVFKHGASQMISRPWIRLSICIEDNLLRFSVANGRPVEAGPVGERNGIGMNNVKKRLQLLYPAEHELQIESTADRFGVKLLIVLKKEIPDQERKSSLISPLQTRNYATY